MNIKYLFESSNKDTDMTEEQITEIKNQAIYNYQFALSKYINGKKNKYSDIREYVMHKDFPDTLK